MNPYPRIENIHTMLTQVIESGGAADADDYDIEAIAAKCFEYDRALNRGEGGFIQSVTDEALWAAIEDSYTGEEC